MAVSSNDIVRLIREKQAQIERLQAELDEARQLLLGHSRLSPIANPTVIYTDPALRPRKRSTGTSVQWAEDVLREANKPMHVNDIIASIARRFGAPVQYSTLVGNLSRSVKANKTFARFGRNVFGLIEWREKEGEQAGLLEN